MAPTQQATPVYSAHEPSRIMEKTCRAWPLLQTEGVSRPKVERKKKEEEESKPGKHRIHSAPWSPALWSQRKHPLTAWCSNLMWSKQTVEPDLCKSLQKLEVCFCHIWVSRGRRGSSLIFLGRFQKTAKGFNQKEAKVFFL